MGQHGTITSKMLAELRHLAKDENNSSTYSPVRKNAEVLSKHEGSYCLQGILLKSKFELVALRN